MVDSTDDLSRLLFVSREQNGRDKIDGQSRPREPQDTAVLHWQIPIDVGVQLWRLRNGKNTLP